MTKKFFMFLTAVLLMSAGAMAQSGNSKSVRGDVNEDGVVNGTDIQEVINIIVNGPDEGETTYYWYLGTTKPTDDAFIESNGKQISNSSEIGSFTIDSDEYVYFVYPTAFGTATIIDSGGFEAGGKAVETLSGVSLTNYKGWRFNKYNSGIIYTITFPKENTYYWYIGQDDPSAMTEILPIVTDNSSPGWREIGNEIGSYTLNSPLWDGTENIITVGASKAITYVALPNTTLKMRDSEGDELDALWTNKGTKSINGVNYTIYQSVANMKIFNNIIF
jgi:hypothetical protein